VKTARFVSGGSWKVTLLRLSAQRRLAKRVAYE
jgi:hypothetical protein